MQSRLFACATAVCTLLFLDAIWLSLGGVGHRFLSTAANIVKVQPWNPWQTAIFVVAAYSLLSVALCATVLSDRDPVQTAVKGALVGLVIYGVYDFTNLAVFGQAYSLDLAFSDIAWGIFVMGTSSLMGSLAGYSAHKTG
jgi:uncharacterized membrane protein